MFDARQKPGPKLVGYARISTDEQTIAAQVDALRGAGCDVIFADEGVSGTVTERPGLAQALDALDAGDSLVIVRFDRLARSLGHLVEVAQALQGRGVFLRSLSDAIDTSTASGRFTYHVLGAVAQFERDLIAERTREALRAKSRRGERLGRPRALTPEQVARAKRHIDRGEAVSAIARDLRVSRRTLHRALATSRLIDAA